MTPILQALNIGSLAAWLTVSSASTVACYVNIDFIFPEKKTKSDVDLIIDFGEEVDTTLPEGGSAAPGEPTLEEPEATPEPEPVELVEPVEEVPEIPDLAEIEPLPEVPDLPEPKVEDLKTEKPKPKPKPRVASQDTRPRTTTTAPRGGANGATGAGNGVGNDANAGSGSGGSGSARFSKGRYPDPDYPDSCKARGEEGVVVIGFNVDASGRVISARIIKGCPFPALNQAALAGAYRWKVPASTGGGSANKPVRFKLTSR